VNEKSISLASGQSFLSISDSLINATVIKGEIHLDIESNALWTANVLQDWIIVHEENKTGSGTLKILWDDNDGTESRSAEIVITTGDIVKIVKVNQSHPSKVISVRGIAGDILSLGKSQVEIQFNGHVDIKIITSLYWNCLGEISSPSYNTTRDLATFNFACGGLGASYPFHIEWEDQFGNKFIGDFQVDFFERTLEIEGMIVSRYNVPNQDTQWLLTKSPGKLYHIDLNSLTILKEFPWVHDNIFGDVLTQSPYDQMLYIANGHAIDIVNPQTGKRNRRVTLPPVERQPHSNYYVRDMGFNKKGMGILSVYQTGSSGKSWFIMDTANGDRIYTHPINGWDADQYYDISHLKTSHDQSSIFLYATGIEERGLVKADDTMNTFTMIQSFSYIRSLLGAIYYSRASDKILFTHSEIDVLEGNHLFELGYLGFGHFVADFAYQSNFTSHVYIAESDGRSLLLLDYKNGQILKRFPISGGIWNRLTATLNGEFLLAESNDSGYDPVNETFFTKIFQYSTALFK
jgi:hypothetical protein